MIRNLNKIVKSDEDETHIDVLSIRRKEYATYTDLTLGDKLVARFFGYADFDNGSTHAKMLSDSLKKQYRQLSKMLSYVPPPAPPPKVYTQDQNADRILKAL